MAFFGNTFREKIKDELKRRRDFDGVQDVLVPHVRVTSMVQTPASGISVNGFSLPAIKGFTLGPHDLVSNTTLDSLSNINNTGCVIGTTYIDGSPKQVVVPTHKNLPSPGVTNVSIETKGGLMFKATIDLKFYGKEQYDVIYQLFMKPGRPIAIEFGHTNTNKKDLDFFTDFDEAITKFAADLREFKPSIPDNPNSGVAVGLVSNFKISLNENNEYEATIDLVNGLEFMFTLPVEETSLDFKQRGLSKSIKENFGMTTGLEYTPKFDCVYKTILDDLQTNPQYAREILWPDNKDVDQFAGSRVALEFRGESTGFLKNVNLQRQMNFVYVGMDYLITVLIPKILQSTNGGLIRNLNDNTIDRRQENNVKLPIIDFGPVGRWDTLRSNNISNVIFNNVNLYNTNSVESTKFGSRIEDYQERFETLDESEFSVLMSSLFFSTPEWQPTQKNTYPSVIPPDPNNLLPNYKRLNNTTNPDGNDLPNYLSGIFVSYGLVKSSLTSSNSLSEAIIKILNSINAASTDILKLKLQIVRDVNKKTNEETERLIIYDEREAFRPEDLLEIYTFFQDNKSEAISYNFDFSLPSAVASTVVANQWKGNDDAEDSVGDSEVSHMIRNGYVAEIDTIIDFEPLSRVSSSVESEQDSLRCGDVWLYNREINERNVNERNQQTENNEDSDTAEEVLKQITEDTLLQELLGYRELVPSGLKAQLIRQGNGDGEKLYDTLPTGAKVTLTLQGLDGFRFGDLFSVENVLPFPYSENALFYLTAYSHNITPDGWTTTINGQYITLTPSSQRENINNSTRVTTRTPSRTNAQEVEFLTPTGGILTDNTIIVNTLPNDQIRQLNPLMLKIVEEVRNRLPEGKVMRVVSGYRSRERNSEVGGAPNSRHLSGKAVDVNLYIRQPGPSEAYEFIAKPLVRESRNAYTNKCITEYQELNQIFQQVSRELNVPVTWGGLFTSFYDANHFHIDAEGPVA